TGGSAPPSYKQLRNDFQPFVTLGTHMESCVFVCEDFPKENQKLANEQLTLVKLKLAIFYILCWA
uniref:hypothetical protein n=1 Tax=Yeosuana marina TaxID=1565536 RepID=UPI0019D2550A